MDCTRYFKKIELFDFQESSDSIKGELTNHLDVCPECHQYYRLTREIDKRLKEEFANIEVSRAIDSKIKSRLDSLTLEFEREFERLLECLVEHSEEDFHALAPETFYRPESEYYQKFLSRHPVFQCALPVVPFTGELIGIRESRGLEQAAMGILYRFNGAHVLVHAFDCRGNILGRLAENAWACFKNARLNTVSWRNGNFVFTVTTDNQQIDLALFQNLSS